MSNSKNNPTDWGQEVKLTPEQIILWLEGHRALMHEVWKNNPGSRELWEQTNLKPAKPTTRPNKS